MKKIEMIWRELLFQVVKNNQRQFRQKDLAEKFGFSTSTISQALKIPRRMGAVEVGGRNFLLKDPEKLLYCWASYRRPESDLIFKAHLDLMPEEIEALVPPEVVFGGYSAAKNLLPEPPADYSKVYLYLASNKLEELKQRYQLTKGQPNLFVFKADPFLKKYGETTTISQTFVDLWNSDDWYAKEFTRALKAKIDGLLS